MSEHWTQEFTLDEVALALAQFAIARGAPLPYAFNMDEPTLTKLDRLVPPHNYMRLRYAAKAAPTHEPAPNPPPLQIGRATSAPISPAPRGGEGEVVA